MPIKDQTIKYSSFMILVYLLISCEETSHLSTGSQQTSVTVMRTAGQSTIVDADQDFSIGQTETDLGNSTQISDIGTDMNVVIEEPDMLTPLPVDLSIVDLGLSIDMMSQVICMENDLRQSGTCGYEKCINGAWEESLDVSEVCNQWDDDCDGTVDEDPSPNNLISECCDSLNCMSRSYCNNGRCELLGHNECRLHGDCHLPEECTNNICTSLYEINPPQYSITCENPMLANIGDASRSGDFASYLFSSERCSDPEFQVETIAGPEMIFKTIILVPGIYSFTSRVNNGDIDIPSSISLLSDCIEETTLWCYSTDIEPINDNGGRVILQNNVQFNLNPGHYFIIVDTHYQKLYETLRDNNQQLSDLEYVLSITQR